MATIQRVKLTFFLMVATWFIGAQSVALAQTKFLTNFDNNGQVNQGQLGPPHD
jgi:hypothetical protein